MQILAVCHTAIPEGDQTPELIRYQAESPDEAAFVVAAKKFGFFFYKRSAESIWVKEETGKGTVADCKYDILNVLEFNSTRWISEHSDSRNFRGCRV